MPILVKVERGRDEKGELFSDQWRTPPEEFEKTIKSLPDAGYPQIDFFASAENSMCCHYVDFEQDSFKTDWLKQIEEYEIDPIAWSNPPYSQQILGRSIAKAFAAGLAGVSTYHLVPASVSTRWYHRYVAPMPEAYRNFREGRICFLPPPGVVSKDRPSGDSLRFLFTPRVCHQVAFDQKIEVVQFMLRWGEFTGATRMIKEYE